MSNVTDRVAAVIVAVQAFLENAKGAVKRAAQAVFPPELFRYIPGQKLIAGAVVYIVASVVGLDANHVFTLPAIGEVTVEDAAAFVAVYLWPTNKPVVEPPIV